MPARAKGNGRLLLGAEIRPFQRFALPFSVNVSIGIENRYSTGIAHEWLECHRNQTIGRLYTGRLEMAQSGLSAMEMNDRGVLLSSDFPYFRLPNPEQYIGIVVPQELKSRLQLFVEGDRINLPQILGKVDSIDIFHYDSDKSYSGRGYAISLIADYLSDRGVILMDDIQDNSFFHDLIGRSKPNSWFVFEFQGKYVEMIGTPERRAAEFPQ